MHVDHDLPGAAAALSEVVKDHAGGEPLCTQLALLRRGERPVAELELELRQPVVRLAAPIAGVEALVQPAIGPRALSAVRQPVLSGTVARLARGQPGGLQRAAEAAELSPNRPVGNPRAGQAGLLGCRRSAEIVSPASERRPDLALGPLAVLVPLRALARLTAPRPAVRPLSVARPAAVHADRAVAPLALAGLRALRVRQPRVHRLRRDTQPGADLPQKQPLLAQPRCFGDALRPLAPRARRHCKIRERVPPSHRWQPSHAAG